MSEDDKKFISTEISTPEKIEVVSNGVDAAWFNEIKHNLPSQPTIFIELSLQLEKNFS